MTLDITIGKAELSLNDYHYGVNICQCPESKENICDSEFTAWPKESYRSGSSDFWLFFRRYESLQDIYLAMREYPNSNDYECIALKPFIARIQQLDENYFNDSTDKDRLKWLKYWSKKAVELYGDLAAISFS